MVQAGAVVFAPRLGGQAEILAHECLLFDGEAEVIEKIEAVLRSVELQASLRRQLSARPKQFSAAAFMSQCRSILASHARALQGEEVL
jgi:hypothetical protein